jgi:hypothetical protein
LRLAIINIRSRWIIQTGIFISQHGYIYFDAVYSCQWVKGIYLSPGCISATVCSCSNRAGSPEWMDNKSCLNMRIAQKGYRKRVVWLTAQRHIASGVILMSLVHHSCLEVVDRCNLPGERLHEAGVRLDIPLHRQKGRR